MIQLFKRIYERVTSFFSSLILVVSIAGILAYKGYLEYQKQYHPPAFAATSEQTEKRSDQAVKGCIAMPDDILVCDKGVEVP